MKPGGTLANWGYALPTVKGDKASSDLIREFAYGDSFLGPYWEARRKYVDEEYASIHPDPELFEDVKRERFPSYTDCTVDHFVSHSPLCPFYLWAEAISPTAYHQFAAATSCGQRLMVNIWARYLERVVAQE